MNPDDFIQMMCERRSIRRYEHRPIEREVIEKMIRAASFAPSASNRQDCEFLVISSPTTKKDMTEAAQEAWEELLAGDKGSVGDSIRHYAGNFDWFAEAPVVIVVTCKRPESFLNHLLSENAGDVAGMKLSAAMATQNLMLAAHALGLGSCCLTGPLAAADKLKQLLNTGRRREIVCLITLGYPAEHPSTPARKLPAHIASFPE